MPIVILLVPCVWAGYAFLLPSEIQHLEGMDALRQEKKALGALSHSEKWFILIFSITLILWFTDKFNGIPPQTASMIALCALALPGIKIFDWAKDSKDIGWDAIILQLQFYSAALSRENGEKYRAYTVYNPGMASAVR